MGDLRRPAMAAARDDNYAMVLALLAIAEAIEALTAELVGQDMRKNP